MRTAFLETFVSPSCNFLLRTFKIYHLVEFLLGFGKAFISGSAFISDVPFASDLAFILDPAFTSDTSIVVESLDSTLNPDHSPNGFPLLALQCPFHDIPLRDIRSCRVPVACSAKSLLVHFARIAFVLRTFKSYNRPFPFAYVPSFPLTIRRPKFSGLHCQAPLKWPKIISWSSDFASSGPEFILLRFLFDSSGLTKGLVTGRSVTSPQRSSI
mmetsp:Transcript_2002/g.2848  ORF Transcript_2002/g.2848 Transcript_2002/m.2848 type:complete len:213 (+) Transcript_2002:266-904(+)